VETMAELWPQTAKLTTLDDLIEAHAEELEKNGGDLEAIPEIAAILAFDEPTFLQELERWALKIQALKADAEAVKAERVRLELKEKRWMKSAEHLKSYMHRQMEGRKIGRHKTPLVSITIARNSAPSVRAASEDTLEELHATGSPFVKQEVSYKLERDLILAAQKDGQDLPVGILVSTGTHVRIS
jgi:hypothetical protein